MACRRKPELSCLRSWAARHALTLVRPLLIDYSYIKRNTLTSAVGITSLPLPNDQYVTVPERQPVVVVDLYTVSQKTTLKRHISDVYVILLTTQSYSLYCHLADRRRDRGNNKVRDLHRMLLFWVWANSIGCSYLPLPCPSPFPFLPLFRSLFLAHFVKRPLKIQLGVWELAL